MFSSDIHTPRPLEVERCHCAVLHRLSPDRDYGLAKGQLHPEQSGVVCVKIDIEFGCESAELIGHQIASLSRSGKPMGGA
ncbi:hypothetical protein AB1N83_007053 [Pleurotus pulmonarius]